MRSTVALQKVAAIQNWCDQPQNAKESTVWKGQAPIGQQKFETLHVDTSILYAATTVCAWNKCLQGHTLHTRRVTQVTHLNSGTNKSVFKY